MLDFAEKPRLRLLLDHFASIEDDRKPWRVATSNGGKTTSIAFRGGRESLRTALARTTWRRRPRRIESRPRRRL
jgi:hypothetical protein